MVRVDLIHASPKPLPLPAFPLQPEAGNSEASCSGPGGGTPCGPGLRLYSLSHPVSGLNTGGFILLLHHILPPLHAGLMLQPVSPAGPTCQPGLVISLSAAGLACRSTLLLFIPGPNRPTWLSRSSANSLFLLDNSYSSHLFNNHGSSAFCACQVLC
uniref:Uncharacterized protein n=1 Tax=Myotis myotis TaxID=51298 RepID=A0A7J7WW05_MYOMY|nr:hypothetical protein mMyoMyo1_011978 [Myotis myotis]